MPAGLNALQKAAWRDIVAALDADELLDRCDAGLIEYAAVMLGRAREAGTVVDREGLLVVNARGRTVEHPAVRLEREALGFFRELASSFGLSPAGRARLRLA